MAINKAALDRLRFNLNDTLHNREIGLKPYLSAADFDELKYLLDFLGDQLPKQVHELVSTGYSRDPDTQFELADRMLRLLNLVDEFGSKLEENQIEDELTPTFQLSPPDSERVLTLSGQMREIVHASKVFDAPHKRRLLNRIAAIEQQVHSEKGRFDVILGGISDLGETIGKFGTDIKPLTDRMSEIRKITRQATKEYDQLPAPDEIKKLPAPDEPQGDFDEEE